MTGIFKSDCCAISGATLIIDREYGSILYNIGSIGPLPVQFPQPN